MIEPMIILAIIQVLCISPGLAVAPLAPSHEVARQNGFHIFNSIHSAMRQWGSSLNHNGMALIPATVPRGSLFYHGTHRNRTAGPPPGPEWLAFEIEHAETFAFSMRYNDSVFGDYMRDTPVFPNSGRQKVMGVSPDEDVHLLSYNLRGYLHTYQTTRDLKLLYVDGSSAGKSDMGMLDTQDLILRSLRNSSDNRPAWDEWDRARDLCSIVTDWGYDGIIRMEIGFEIIHCDFSSGLDLLSVLRRPFFDPGHSGARVRIIRNIFQFARAITHRYDGFDSNRVKLDFSRLVSAYFYPINLTNPDPEAKELPRLMSTTMAERRSVRSRVVEANKQLTSPNIEWQSIVDMIVSRYGDRLALMKSPSIHATTLVQEVYKVTDTYFEYPKTSEDINSQPDPSGENEALQRCIGHYLQPVEIFQDSFTQEDKLIYTAITSVTTRICETLFESRTLIQNVESGSLQHSGRPEELEAKFQQAAWKSQKLILDLADSLRWTDWRKCRGCTVDEICFVAMWPYGRPVDHYHPGCVNETVFDDPLENNYWFPHGVPGQSDRILDSY